MQKFQFSGPQLHSGFTLLALHEMGMRPFAVPVRTHAFASISVFGACSAYGFAP